MAGRGKQVSTNEISISMTDLGCEQRGETPRAQCFKAGSFMAWQLRGFHAFLAVLCISRPLATDLGSIYGASDNSSGSRFSCLSGRVKGAPTRKPAGQRDVKASTGTTSTAGLLSMKGLGPDGAAAWAAMLTGTPVSLHRLSCAARERRSA